jgi:hypothetical protein
MKKTLMLSAFCLACLVRAAYPQAMESSSSLPEMPICKVTAESAKYDGKEVVVRGLYRMVIHGTILIGNGCPNENVNLREAPGYKASKKASAMLRSLTKKDQFAPVEVVLRGTFRVAHQGQCFGQDCAVYELESLQLLSAQAPSPAPGGSSPDALNTAAHESGHVEASKGTPSPQ